MVSEVSICNSALAKIGAPRIASLTDGSTAAQVANEQYAKIRDQVTSAHPWVFAKKRQSLALLDTTPPFGFKLAYQLPDDCLGVLEVNDELIPYKIEGRQLLCDYTGIMILYISQVTDPTLFDQTYLTALEFRLASEFAYAITQNATLAQSMYTAYKAELKEARSINSQRGGTPNTVIQDTFIRRRF